MDVLENGILLCYHLVRNEFYNLYKVTLVAFAHRPALQETEYLVEELALGDNFSNQVLKGGVGERLPKFVLDKNEVENGNFGSGDVAEQINHCLLQYLLFLVKTLVSEERDVFVLEDVLEGSEAFDALTFTHFLVILLHDAQQQQVHLLQQSFRVSNGDVLQRFKERGDSSVVGDCAEVFEQYFFGLLVEIVAVELLADEIVEFVAALHVLLQQSHQQHRPLFWIFIATQASEEGSVLVDDLLTKFEVAEDHFEYLVLLHPFFPFFFPLFPESIVVALDVIFHESQSCPPHFPLAGPKEYFG